MSNNARIMPKPFAPQTFICPACGWRQSVIYDSDVLCEGRTWFHSCPECGRDQPERRAATRLECYQLLLRDLLKPRRQH